MTPKLVQNQPKQCVWFCGLTGTQTIITYQPPVTVKMVGIFIDSTIMRNDWSFGSRILVEYVKKKGGYMPRQIPKFAHQIWPEWFSWTPDISGWQTLWWWDAEFCGFLCLLVHQSCFWSLELQETVKCSGSNGIWWPKNCAKFDKIKILVGLTVWNSNNHNSPTTCNCQCA